MNGSFGAIDPVTTYRLIQADHGRRRHHAHLGDVHQPSGRRSVARGLRRVADLLDN
jgi:hypothetical protein